MVDGRFFVFSAFLPFFRLERISRYYQDVFSGIEDYPISVATIVHGSLHLLFSEASDTVEDQAIAAEYQKYSTMCEENFEACLSNLDLLMPATFESIAALMIGVS